VGTFGKALGLFGAFVLLPKRFKEYLLNFSSPQIYTTTLPEAHAASAIDLLNITSRADDRRTQLKEVSLLMKNRLREECFKINGDAHIIAVEIGKEGEAAELSQKLYAKKNILAFSARYPTVPMGKAIIRIGMSALHNEEDVEAFVSGLKSCIKKET